MSINLLSSPTLPGPHPLPSLLNSSFLMLLLAIQAVQRKATGQEAYQGATRHRWYAVTSLEKQLCSPTCCSSNERFCICTVLRAACYLGVPLENVPQGGCHLLPNHTVSLQLPMGRKLIQGLVLTILLLSCLLMLTVDSLMTMWVISGK